VNIRRDVKSAVLRTERIPGTSRRTRWWDLELSCGHKVTRPVRYQKKNPAQTKGTRRPVSDALPPQQRVSCPDCLTLCLNQM